MSQIFDKDGKVIPVTLVEAGPCFVIQIKTKEKDGYEAIQLGFSLTSEKHINKAQKGHFGKIGGKETKTFRYLKEFKAKELDKFKLGDEIRVNIFNSGDVVRVAGVSKGKGFQGVVKRYGFKGGPASHGQKHTLRAPGSIGSAFPERVFKGKRMAGRMGGSRVNICGSQIAAVDEENNLLAVKGAVPGRKGTLLEIVANN